MKNDLLKKKLIIIIKFPNIYKNFTVNKNI